MITLAGCVVTNVQDEILLLHRNTPHRSQWETPGGKIGGSEPVAAAARRCAEEEVGAILQLTRLLGSCQFASDGLRYSYLWFHARVRHGSIEVINPRKHDKWRFFGWNSLHKIVPELSGNVSQLYKQYGSGAIRLPSSAELQSATTGTPAPAVPLVAGCVIQDARGRVLLLHRFRSGRDVWEIPGGKVEIGETPQSCAAREANEELNVTVDIGHCLGMRSLRHRDKQLLYVWFSADIAKGTPKIVERGIHDRLDYMSWDDLRQSTQEYLSSSVRALVAARDEAMSWESDHRPDPA